MVRKVVGPDAGTIYAMKVLKKATLKGISISLLAVSISLVFQRPSLTAVSYLFHLVVGLQKCTSIVLFQHIHSIR